MSERERRAIKRREAKVRSEWEGGATRTPPPPTGTPIPARTPFRPDSGDQEKKSEWGR